MTICIWKTPLLITDVDTVSLPDGAVPLSVQAQGDDLVAWFRVDDRRPLRTMQIEIYGTGHPMPKDHGDYIGTAMTHGGRLVWHVHYTWL